MATRWERMTVEQREREVERVRQWRLANPERLRANRRKEWEDNREKILARTAEWVKAHPEQAREYGRRWREANPEKQRAAEQRWRENNRAYNVERGREWAKNNPDKVRGIALRRHARKLGAEGSHTHEEFMARCEEYDWKCAYCEQEADLGREHLVPLIRGGSDYIENIVPACQPCNSRKATRTAEEFLLAFIGEEND